MKFEKLSAMTLPTAEELDYPVDPCTHALSGSGKNIDDRCRVGCAYSLKG